MSEILERVHARLSPSGAWTQRVMARDADGVGTQLGYPEAVSFCLLGALEIETPTYWDQNITARRYLCKATGVEETSLAHWNDRWFRTKGSVLRAVKKAATLAKADGQ